MSELEEDICGVCKKKPAISHCCCGVGYCSNACQDAHNDAHNDEEEQALGVVIEDIPRIYKAPQRVR